MRRYCSDDLGPISSADRHIIPHKTHNMGILPEISAVSIHARQRNHIRVNVSSRGAVPNREFPVQQGHQHPRAIRPGHTVHHGPQLVKVCVWVCRRVCRGGVHQTNFPNVQLVVFIDNRQMTCQTICSGLVQTQLVDFVGVLERGVGILLPRDDIQHMDQFLVGSVPDSDGVIADRSSDCVHEFWLEPSKSGAADESTIVGEDLGAQEGIDQEKVLFRLQNEPHGAVFEVENGGSVPVLHGINYTLGGGGHDQIAEIERSFDDWIAKFQILPGCGQNIFDQNPVALHHHRIDILPHQFLLHQSGKPNRTIRPSRSQLSTITGPRKLQYRPRLWLLQRIRPPNLVTQPQTAEASRSKQLPVWRPTQRRDWGIKGATREEGTPIRIPYFIPPILAPRYDPIVDSTPINHQHHPVVGLPRGRLCRGLQGLDDQLLIVCVQDCFCIGAPRYIVHGVCGLCQNRSEHPRFRPHLDLPIFSRSQDCGSVSAPLHRKHGSAMRLHRLLDAAHSREEVIFAVAGAHKHEFWRAAFFRARAGQPLHVGGERIGGQVANTCQQFSAVVPLLNLVIVRARIQFVVAGPSQARDGVLMCLQALFRFQQGEFHRDFDGSD
eukprot:Sdes_comp15780_c0_seq1m4842